MKEFLSAALPWICIGLILALCAYRHSLQKEDSSGEHRAGGHLLDGLCIGLCIGTALDSGSLVYWMLLWLIVGLCLRKEKKSA